MEEEFNNLDEITNYIYGDEDVIDFDFEKSWKMKNNNLTGEDFILLNSQKANYSIFISKNFNGNKKTSGITAG